MEDYKILLYIFGIVIYIIYTAMRRFFNPEQQAPDREERPVPKYQPPSENRPRQQTLPEAWPSEPPRQQAPKQARPVAPASPPPTSFEEMMRRLEKPAEKPREMAEKQVEKAQEKAEEIRSKAAKARDLVKQRVTDYNRAESRPVINYETSSDWRKRPKEVPSMRIAALQPGEKRVHPYVAMLQNPKDARAAFVLTQILERKEW
jgi:type IV secretory pathway VirB10-like protein